jgi:hypothetical protein
MRAIPATPIPRTLSTTGADYVGRAGADVKMGLGPNLTLDGTVNPDFGQVDADPAVVNLTAYEIFFPERRPFFTEGNNLLRGNGPGYYYSRRIGAPPHGDPGGDFINTPDNTTIIGAAKITGRTAKGLSVGSLFAVTANEYADTFDTVGTVKGHSRVEPLTSFGVARVQQEFGPSASTIGVTLTGVERDLGRTSWIQYSAGEPTPVGSTGTCASRAGPTSSPATAASAMWPAIRPGSPTCSRPARDTFSVPMPRT